MRGEGIDECGPWDNMMIGQGAQQRQPRQASSSSSLSSPSSSSSSSSWDNLMINQGAEQRQPRQASIGFHAFPPLDSCLLSLDPDHTIFSNDNISQNVARGVTFA